MGIMDKMKDFIGLGEEEYDEDEDERISQEEIDRYDREHPELRAEARLRSMPAGSGSGSVASATGFDEPLRTGISPREFTHIEPPAASEPRTLESRDSINQSDPFRMIVIEPKSFDECQKLIENLRQRKPLIVNFENLESDIANRLFCYLSGATYALQGKAQKVRENIIIFAPKNVNIKAMVERATEAGKPANSNPWK